MSKIRSYKDIEHKLELMEVQKEVNLDKLKDGIQRTKRSLYPALFTFSLKTILGRKKRKKKVRKEN